MRVALNVVLKKEHGDTYNVVDEITMEFNTLYYTKMTEINHYENDIDLPVFCNSSILLTNVFENSRISKLLCKDLINNKMHNKVDDGSFILKRNVKIINGFRIDIIMTGESFRCIAATQGFFFSDLFDKTIGALFSIENNRIVGFDGNSFCRYINKDIEYAAEGNHSYNYDGIIYYDHHLPYVNHPLEDLGLASMKGECTTRRKRIVEDDKYLENYIIYNRRDMIKSLFRR